MSLRQMQVREVILFQINPPYNRCTKSKMGCLGSPFFYHSFWDISVSSIISSGIGMGNNHCCWAPKCRVYYAQPFSNNITPFFVSVFLYPSNAVPASTILFVFHLVPGPKASPAEPAFSGTKVPVLYRFIE